MGPMFSPRVLGSQVKRCINQEEHKQTLMKSEYSSQFAGARPLGNLGRKTDGRCIIGIGIFYTEEPFQIQREDRKEKVRKGGNV